MASICPGLNVLNDRWVSGNTSFVELQMIQMNWGLFQYEYAILPV